MPDFSCFMAYDIRGRVPEQLDEDFAWRLGQAFVAEWGVGPVVVGYDVRLESPGLAAALVRGLTTAGADVLDIGLCGTEEVYFATVHHQAIGGIMVTASHNPKGYNGMKLVRAGAQPISGDTGLYTLRTRMQQLTTVVAATPGQVHAIPDKTAYIQHLLSYIDRDALRPLHIVADPGHGGAGPIIEALAPFLAPLRLTLIHGEPDGQFPVGVPNPLLPERRAATAAAVLEQGADFGIAWDGDFDRCFLFDHRGQFIEGYYLVGLLAEVMLAKHPGSRILHDPRLTWNTIDQVQAAGGVPIQTKTGHAFMKERLRQEDAVYGGEMSAHHYFRDFAYCDSGMLPWLLVAELLSRRGETLEACVAARMAAYPCSGEINFTVANVDHVLERILAHYAPLDPQMDRTDGVSLAFADWRFNLRASNTEPLLRLNIESRGDPDLVARKLDELRALILPPHA